MQLPMTVKFHSEETPLSLASRLAAANGFSSLSQFNSHIGLKAAAISSGDIHATKLLSDLSGVAVGDLYRFTVKPTSHKLCSFGGNMVRRQPDRARHHTFCPRCIREDLANGIGRPVSRPYARYQWLAPGIQHCVVHGNELLLSPRGDHEHDFARFVERNHEEIAQKAQVECSTKASPLEIYLSDRLASRVTNGFLDTIELYVVQDFCQAFGGFLSRNGAPSVEHNEADAAFVVAANGPNAIEAATIDVIAHSLPMTHNFQSTFGPLLTWLRSNRKRPEFDKLISVFQDIAVRHLPLGTDDVFVRPVERRVLHSVVSASRQYSLTEQKVRAIVLQAGLVPGSTKVDQQFWFDADLSAPLLNAARESVSDADAAAMLGISLTLIRDLRRSNTFPAHPGRQSQSNFHRLHPLDIEALQDALFRGTPIVKGTVGLSSLAQSARAAQCTFEEVVRLARDKAFSSLCTVNEERILPNLRLDAAEVRLGVASAREKGKTDNFVERLHELGQLPKILGTSNAIVRYLVNSGCLKAEKSRDPFTHAKKLLVTRDAVKEFMANNISLSEVASQLKLSSRETRKRLGAEGITPSCEPVPRSLAFFRRIDIARLVAD